MGVTNEQIEDRGSESGQGRGGRAAVPAPTDSVDAGVPWHFGDPLREQQLLVRGLGSVDLSHRGVLTVTGPDRLSWLHDITTAFLRDLTPATPMTALVLSPNGHVEHELHVVDDGLTTWITTERVSVDGLLTYLNSMRFMLRVEIADVTAEWAVIGYPGAFETDRVVWRSAPVFAGRGEPDPYVPVRPIPYEVSEVLVPRADLVAALADSEPVGTWAWEALRVAAGVPRFGFETDHRTIPHEVGWIGSAVHLVKGCYRGQETVARVHNLGRPPRRLVLLNLDGSAEHLPAHGAPVVLGDKEIGFITSAARHYEHGPVALALIKRNTAVDVELTADGVAAAQEILVAP